jgi:hypothetical protein
MIATDAERLRGKACSKKRAGSVLEAASMRPRQEVPRPNWVAETCAATSRQDGIRRGGDRGRPPFRDRGRGWVRGRGESRAISALSIIYSSRILCLSFVLSYSCHPVILSYLLNAELFFMF